MASFQQLVITAAFLAWLSSSQLIAPAHRSGQQDALYHDRYKRGYITDNAVEDEKVDQTSLRRDNDHFADFQSNDNSADVSHGYLGEDGLFTSSKGKQNDRQKQQFDRNSLVNDRIGVRRHAANTADSQTETGAALGRVSHRAALGGPYQASDYASDGARFDRIDTANIGRTSDYAKDADRSLATFDRGIAQRSAGADVAIVQDGARGAASTGTESGQASKQRETGAILKQGLLERASTTNNVAKTRDAIGAVKAKRASTAFGPDGAVAAHLGADQTAWDRAKLDHRDTADFVHASHDNIADVNHEKSKAAVDLKIAIGNGIPGDVSCGDRTAKAVEAHDRIVERDAGDRLTTNLESETLSTFDVGGKTIITDEGVAIGVPSIV